MTAHKREVPEISENMASGTSPRHLDSIPTGVQHTGMPALARTWLSLQCSMLSGVNRAVVLLGAADSGAYHAVARWPEGSQIDHFLIDAANQAIRERRSGLYGAQQSTSAESRVDVITCPLLINAQVTGAVAVEVTSRPDKNQQAALRVLQWGAAWFEMLFNHETDPLEHRLLTVVDVLAKSLEQRELSAAAMAVATELTNRTGCDRVSLGLRDGHEIHIEAISQAVQIDDKTNLVRALGNAMQEALDQDASVLYPVSAGTDAAPTTAHTSLARGFGAGAICTVPLSNDGQAIGAVLLERTRQQPFDAETVSLLEYLASLIGPILDFKRREQRSLVAKTASAIKDRFIRPLGTRQLAWKTAALGLAAIAVGFFMLGETEYRIDAKAHLQGTVQRVVIAPFDSYLVEAPVRAGDLVRAGQLMCRLEDRELSLERASLSGERAKFIKEYREALATHDRSRNSVLKARLDQADAELALIEQKLGRTRVDSPLDGIVVSGDHSQALGAPVQRGQVLFEVAPLNSYRIILNVDEREIAAVRANQTGQLILASLPNDVYPFTVKRITPMSVALEGQNLFRIEADLNDGGELLRPGMHGVGKIDTGTRTRFWIWTHGVVDWLRLALWSWWG